MRYIDLEWAEHHVGIDLPAVIVICCRLRVCFHAFERIEGEGDEGGRMANRGMTSGLNDDPPSKFGFTKLTAAENYRYCFEGCSDKGRTTCVYYSNSDPTLRFR
jgi:hypothetical protein